MKLNKLETELINDSSKNIDRVSTKELVRIINDEDKKIAFEIEKKSDVIAEAIDIITNRLSDGGRLFYIGAGTSGRLGILDASEIPPTFGVDNEVIGLIAGGIEATYLAKEGAEDVEDGAIIQLKENNFNSKDVLVGIAASGRTPYVKGGLNYARSIGAKTISVACVSNSQVGECADLAIDVPVYAEVVTGSTRLKAGTATKMILNMLTTGSMIKTGRVYHNLMVNVKATNEKLVRRAINIVMEITGKEEVICEKAFYENDKNVSLTILVLESGLNKEKATNLLSENNNNLTKALGSLT